MTGSAAAVAVAINLLFVPTYGMMATAFANVIAFTVMFLGITWWSQRVFPVPYQWRRVVTVVGCAVVLTIAGKALERPARRRHRPRRRLPALPVAPAVLPPRRARLDQTASGSNRAVKCRSADGSHTIR